MTAEELRDKFKKKDKVVILGFADSWKKAPFNDDSFEFWGLNSLFEMIPRWDLWFEIHDVNLFELRTNKEIGYGLTRTGQPYLEALGQLKCKDGTPCPVMMVDAYPDIPNSVRYPFEEMKEKYGDYFTNTISYMICLAIAFGYKEIHIYGVDMATTTEYGSQRPSCEYYVGIAKGMGIKLYIPPEADLLKAEFMYGYEGEKKLTFIAKIENLIKAMDERKGFSAQNQEMAKRTLDQLVGRMEELKLRKTDWPEFVSEESKKKVDDQVNKYNEEWKVHILNLELARKQIDQYIGAIEALKEVMKIRLLFK